MNLLVNGQDYQVEDMPDRLLLRVLRDELGLTNTKFGCGIGICGSRTVHLDGAHTRACITMLTSPKDMVMRTIEGLVETDTAGETILHPVQQAFIEEQVPQCSWCMSGQMMTSTALLDKTQTPVQRKFGKA